MDSEILRAVLKSDLTSLQRLLKNIHKINELIYEDNRMSILHVASGVQSFEADIVVLQLLKYGADPNTRSLNDGLTPVHIASMWNNDSVLEKLLIFGGDPLVCDLDNKNSFDFAKANNSYKSLKLLKESIHKKNTTNLRDLYMALDDISLYKDISYFNNDSDLITSKLFANPGSFSNFNSDISNSNIRFSQGSKNSLSRHSNFNGVNDSTLNNLEFRSSLGIIRLPNTHKTYSFLNSTESDMVSSLIDKTAVTNESLKDKAINVSKGEDNIPSSSGISSTMSSLMPNITSIENDVLEEITHSDEKEGITFIEQRLTLSSSYDKLNNDQSYDSNSSSSSNWKFYQTAYNTLQTSDSFTDNCISDDVPQCLQRLSNMEIYNKLKELGDKPGPVQDSTRKIYLQRLAKIQCGLIPLNTLPEIKYSAEVNLFFEGKLDLLKLQKLNEDISANFDQMAMLQQLRGGNQRCSFTYFLLDPRVTKNLPSKASVLSFAQMFKIFIESIFYVGKGTRGRNFSHLYEAAKAYNDSVKQHSAKILHIIDIWKSDLGVVSLHCFQNSIPVEAFTREACIIEALGLSNLTNIKKGDFYGIVTQWTMAKKRQLGVFFPSSCFRNVSFGGRTTY